MAVATRSIRVRAIATSGRLASPSTHDFSDKLSLGAEVAWQSPDMRGGDSSTGVNLGLIRKLGGPFALLLAAGPSFAGGKAAYHGYAALSLNF